MKLITSAIFSMAALVSFAVQAQQAPPAQRGYVGGSLGYTDFRGPDIGGQSTDRHDTGFKVHGGWEFSPYFAAELGYAYLGKPGSGAGEIKVEGVFIDAVGTFPVSPGFSVLGRIGAFNSKVKSERLGDSDRSTDVKFGVGVQYDINPQMNVRGEYERYRIDAFDVKTDHDMWSIGVNYRF